MFWNIYKSIICAILRYPAHFGVHLIRHDKVSKNVESAYNIKYGNHRLQKYDVHKINLGGKLPTIFYLHGGSWMSMDKKHYNYIVKTVSEEGYIVVNINYRMLPEYTMSEVISDSETAICHALDNIPEIDTSRLFIMGDSAGGHLASLFAAKANSGCFRRKIKFIGAGIYYGLLDMNDMIYGKAWLFKFLTKYFHKEIGKDYKEYLYEFSPLEYFDKDFPPTFLTSGKVDPLNPATMQFIEILNHNGVKNLPLIFPKERKDGLHAFLNLTWLKSSKEALRTMLDFFNELAMIN